MPDDLAPVPANTDETEIAPAPQEPKRPPRWLWLLVGTALAVVLVLVGIRTEDEIPLPTPTPKLVPTQKPTYPPVPTWTPDPLASPEPTHVGSGVYKEGPKAPGFPMGPVLIPKEWICTGGKCDDPADYGDLGLLLGYEHEAARDSQMWLQGQSRGELSVVPQQIEWCLFGAAKPSTVPESEPTFDLVDTFAYTTYSEPPPYNYITALVVGRYVEGGFRPRAGLGCKGERFDDCVSFLAPEGDYTAGPKHVWFQGQDCQRWAPLADLNIGDRPFLVYATWQGEDEYSLPGVIGGTHLAVFVWDEEVGVYLPLSR